MVFEKPAQGMPPTLYILQILLRASVTVGAGATQLYKTIPLLM
jgi:hypothetical protein